MRMGVGVSEERTQGVAPLRGQDLAELPGQGSGGTLVLGAGQDLALAGGLPGLRAAARDLVVPAVRVGDPRLQSEAFRAWFGDSKVVDDQGNPLRVFRGFRRVPKPDRFVTRLKRASLSFTADPASASVYAQDPMSCTYKKGCNVMPVYLSIQNPLDLRGLGEHGNLQDLFELMDHNFYVGYGSGSEVGYEDLAEAIRTLGGTVYRSNAEWEIEASLPGDICRITDFDELAGAISEVGEERNESSVEAIQGMLFDTNIDYYALADNEEFVSLLVEKGYDGIVHMDPTNPNFLRLREEAGHDNEDLEEALESDTKVIETWRPIGNLATGEAMSQIKSALGNSGAFSPSCGNILE